MLHSSNPNYSYAKVQSHSTTSHVLDQISATVLTNVMQDGIWLAERVKVWKQSLKCFCSISSCTSHIQQPIVEMWCKFEAMMIAWARFIVFLIMACDHKFLAAE